MKRALLFGSMSAALILNTVAVFNAFAETGADCGKKNCNSPGSIRACYTCCDNMCTDKVGCQDWCDTRKPKLADVIAND